MINTRPGFNLVELLISIAIIAVLATLATVYLLPARTKARDAKRKIDIAQIGRFLTAGCYLPQAGAGDYDAADLLAELKLKYPDYAGYLNSPPYDPKSGSATETYYHYAVTADNKCILYANLENNDEPVTLPNITVPTPGAGQGVLAAPTPGWNGTNKYFQYSN
ncbi:MAG: type II secretion system protein [Candidatus Kerfeldbacteria bacterium]|nr:type II secretion system protein [Candidatus Kerfeldbacteria bacterium]